MNHKLTTRHLILSVFIDYMLSTGRYIDIIHSSDEVDMEVLKRIMVNESEFPIYTPTNMIFTYIILTILNNQIMNYTVLNNVVRDLDSPHWISIISKVSEIRCFGEENASKNKNFRLFTVKEVCKIYPQFHSLVHSFIKEDLFLGIDPIKKMYPYLSYSSEEIGDGERKLVTNFIYGPDISSMYYKFFRVSSLTPETYHTRATRFLYLTFDKKGEFSEDTIEFILYILSFFYIDRSLTVFEYLNENYDV